MPIYEFECRSCRRKTTALLLSRDRVSEVRCKACGGADLEKLFSRFSSPKSDEARLGALSDPASLSGLDENDPKSVARLMKRMGQEMGEDVSEDMDEALDGGGLPGEDDAGSDDL